MKERGIIFNSEMVRAILDDRKTQTRRVIKPEIPAWTKRFKLLADIWAAWQDTAGQKVGKCPYGVIGDRLYVRETFVIHPKDKQIKSNCLYKADDPDIFKGCAHWRPSIFMPKWAARIWLEITDIRVEKVGDISEEDAVREGFISTAVLTEDKSDYYGLYAFEHFGETWNNIYNDWFDSPWVWVVEFKRIEK